MFTDYITLSLRNIRHRGLRSWLTMLGIFIGIAAVVSLISLGQGLQEAITGQFSSLSVDTLTIQNSGTGFGPPGSTAVQKLTEHDLNIIKEVSGVERAVSRLIRIASFEYNDIRSFKYIASIPENQKDADYVYESTDIKIEEGKILKSSDRGKILLGSDYKGTNEFEKDLRVGSDVVIQGENFEVIGFLKKSATFQVNLVILMTEEDMEKILDIDNEADLIVAKVEDKDRVEDVAKEIERRLRKDRNQKIGEEDFSVTTPLQALDTVNVILNIINIIVTGIAAISLLVGGIGITNSMYTSVLERTREIGVMKAVGAKNSDILYIFLIESALLGLIGGIVGAAIGLGLAFLISVIATSAFGSEILSVRVSWPLLTAAVSFALTLGIISGIVPAYQASKMKPVEALRQ